MLIVQLAKILIRLRSIAMASFTAQILSLRLSKPVEGVDVPSNAVQVRVII